LTAGVVVAVVVVVVVGDVVAVVVGVVVVVVGVVVVVVVGVSVVGAVDGSGEAWVVTSSPVVVVGRVGQALSPLRS